MRQLADDVFQIALAPRNGVNAYLLGDVLVDAGMPMSARKILKELKGFEVRTHALTHAHLDHAGGSKRVSEELGLGVWCGAADAEAMRTGRQVVPAGHLKPVLQFNGKWSGVPIERELKEGDEVGPGFVVLDTPGHSPGHVSFWRERDGILVCGDVFFNMNILTTAPGLHQPFAAVTTDPSENRRSERRLAELEPALALFGHGPALQDPAAMTAFVATLPA